MKCNRCGSAMVYERFYGPDEHFLGWRCILCGEIVDQLILENRTAAGKQAGTKARGRTSH
ncbi:MAG TPA: hypothetical protein VLW47_06195 [Thermodesulfobacteriota bacterium]|nr:hypothetical protein [Thermodesulfobacteriota bacterium]